MFPEFCLQDSWTRFENEFDGGLCKPEIDSIAHISGHKKCVKLRQEPSLEHCVTLDPEPQCDDETHGEILNTVFKKKGETEMQTESRILFPERSQQTTNQGNQS